MNGTADRTEIEQAQERARRAEANALTLREENERLRLAIAGVRLALDSVDAL